MDISWQLEPLKKVKCMPALVDDSVVVVVVVVAFVWEPRPPPPPPSSPPVVAAAARSRTLVCADIAASHIDNSHHLPRLTAGKAVC